ncbi:MAG: ankyrin repeat domain-containing protein [Gemmatimonadales bacterium]
MTTAQDVFDVIRQGDTARLRALLAADPALVNARNERGHSPVLIAQYHHKRELLDLLLDAGPELDIFDAASVGRSARVAELLDRDPSLLNAFSGDGFFPLGLAAFFGHTETVRLLLARGADVTVVARNPMRVQSLHSAVASRNLETVRLLLEAGAPVNDKQQEGWTPLHAAVHNGNAEMVGLLVAHGADPALPNDQGVTPAGMAAEQGSGEILAALTR